MAALVVTRDTPKKQGGSYPHVLNFPAKGAAKVFGGGIVCLDATGYAVKGATATGLKAVGVAVRDVDNTAGADGAAQVEVFQAIARFGNSAAADLIAQADVGTDCYIVDDQTVAKTSGTNTRSVAGKVMAVDSAGVWVRIQAP